MQSCPGYLSRVYDPSLKHIDEFGDIGIVANILVVSAFLLGSHDQVTALSISDGSIRWELTGNEIASGLSQCIAIAADTPGERLYVASTGELRCLDALTGALRWRWQRDPMEPGEEYCRARFAHPPLHATDSLVYLLVNWRERTGEDREPTDIVVLTNTGEVLLHETSPTLDGCASTRSLVTGTELFIRSHSTWERWDVTELAKRNMPE